METCCQLCGAVGMSELLVFCGKCRFYAQHRYCLDKIPSSEEVDIHWLCEQCMPSSPKVVSLNLDPETPEESEISEHDKIVRCMKSQQHQRCNDAEAVSCMKSHLVVCSASDIPPKEVDVATSRVYSEGKDERRKRRRLILDDEDDGDKYDNLGHAGCKSAMQDNEPVLKSSSPKCEKRSSRSSHEVPGMSPVVSHESSDMQGLGHVEASDVPEDRPDNLDKNGVLKTEHSSCSTQGEVENSSGPPTIDSKDKSKKRWRRILILNEEDEDQSDHLDQYGLALNKDILRAKDMNEKGPRMKVIHDKYGKDNNMKRPISMLALDNENKSFGEVQSVSLNLEACNKSRLAVNEPILVNSSFEHLQDSSNSFADEGPLYSRNKNRKSSSTEIVLEDENVADEEVHSVSLSREACNKSSLQINEPILETSSGHLENSANNSADEIPKVLPIESHEVPEHSVDSANSSADEIPNVHPTASHGVSEIQELGHLETTDPNLRSASLHTTNDDQFYSPARPIIDHIWRGTFNIWNEEYGPLKAHLSTRACEKVYKFARSLPPALCAQKLSRLDAWPNSFKVTPPTDDNIALYFLPDDNARAEPMLDQLLEDIINRDLMLQVIFDEAELLIFSSAALPKHYHRFQGKYYLWGVFRGRQATVPAIAANSSPESGLTEDGKKILGSNLTEGEFCSVVSPGISAGSGSDPSMPKCFKLFGISLSVHTMAAEIFSQQQHPMETNEKMDDDVVITSNNISQHENDTTFSQSLRLFGSHVLVTCRSSEQSPIPNQIEFEQTGQSNKAGGHVGYPEISCSREVGHVGIKTTKLPDSYFEVFPTEVEGDFLELFPLRGENADISSKAECTEDLDLKLTTWQ